MCKDPPRFSGKREEYDDWSQEFETVMRLQRMWKYFENDMPADLSDSRQGHWKEKVIIAFGILHACVTPADRVLITNLKLQENGTRKAWDLLKQRKNLTGPAAVTALYNRLNALSMATTETLPEYLSRSDKIWTENEAIKAGIPMAVFLGDVVQGLSSAWDQMRFHLERTQAAWTKDGIWKELMDESSRREARAEREGPPKASKFDGAMLVVKGKQAETPKLAALAGDSSKEELTLALQALQKKSESQRQELSRFHEKLRGAPLGDKKGKGNGKGSKWQGKAGGGQSRDPRGMNPKGKGKFKQGSQFGRGQQSYSTDQKGCWNCGKLGHLKKDCKAPSRQQPQFGLVAQQGVTVQPPNTFPLAAPAQPLALPQPPRAFSLCTAVCPNHAALNTAKVSPSEWIIDTGASAHMSPRKDFFASILDSSCGGIIVGNGEVLDVLGQGTVTLKNAQNQEVNLCNTQYAPKLTVNLISVKQLDQKGLQVAIRDGRVAVYLPTGECVLTATLRQASGLPDELYIVDGAPVLHTGVITSSA